jgi:hypothetical protein
MDLLASTLGEIYERRLSRQNMEDLPDVAGQAAIQRFAPTPSRTEGYQGAYITEGDGFGPLKDLVKAIDPVISRFGAMFTSIGSLKAVVDPLGLVFQGVMNVLGPAIDKVLTPVINVLTSMGEVIGKAVAPAFDFLGSIVDAIVMPALKGLAVGLEILMSPVKFLADLFAWVGKVISDFVYNLTEKGLFEEKRDTAGEFSSTAFSGLAERIAAIWKADYSKGSVYGTPTGAGYGVTTGSNATYSKPRDITVNVQVTTAALVGDGGVRDFAIIIGRELKSSGVLGLS